MNFDIFNDLKFITKESLLENCKSAERNIMISPYNSMANARAALEILCKGLIKQNHSQQICPGNGQPNLATMIDTCLRDGLLQNEEAAAQIRKNGNDTLHANKNSQKLHIVNFDNVEKAKNTVRALFNLLQDAFPEYSETRFDDGKIPFGFYEIVRRVRKAENEIVYGDYNYFVKDPQGNYYYFQIFHRNSELEKNNELGARGVLAGNRIKEDKNRKSYLLDVHYPSNLLAESDREYIAYSVYSDSILLSELKDRKLTERQILQIALDLANVLIELQRVGKGISLRNIQPGNVIITPDGDKYMAGVVNMETAKIKGYQATVFKSMKTLITENVYLPPEVRKGGNPEGIQWDKVDVYSVAKIMMYCVSPDGAEKDNDEDFIYDNFSETTADLLCDIFGSSVNVIDGVEEFREKLQNALDEL